MMLMDMGCEYYGYDRRELRRTLWNGAAACRFPSATGCKLFIARPLKLCQMTDLVCCAE